MGNDICDPQFLWKFWKNPHSLLKTLVLSVSLLKTLPFVFIDIKPAFLLWAQFYTLLKGAASTISAITLCLKAQYYRGSLSEHIQAISTAFNPSFLLPLETYVVLTKVTHVPPETREHVQGKPRAYYAPILL